ncbi:MAG: diguanylate cyclase [Sedimenticola thiotaurini]|uniref:Diguanylate cyclase n=1 Tax=Sedimenticola thiotaurini TaxID=1543721 RepID=A0A558CTZ8_9GAMM|nr:MAG: diguanylate cyclase [Sedimenticola thiotaurini]
MSKPFATKSMHNKPREELEAELDNLYAHIASCGLCDIPNVNVSLSQWLLDDARSQGLLMDLALDAIVIIDETGAIVSFNKSAESIFGYQRREVMGREIASVIIPPSYREQHYEGLTRYLTTGEAKIIDKRVEVTAMRANGEEFPVELTVTAFHVRDLRFFTAFIRDITERVEMEKRLRSETELVQLLHRLTSLANEASNARVAIKGFLREVCEYTGWPVGHVYLVNQEKPFAELISSRCWYLANEQQYKKFREISERMVFASGNGLPGDVYIKGEPVWIEDIKSESNFTRDRVINDLSLKTGFGLPVKIGREVVGVLEFYTPEYTEHNASFLDTLGHIGIELGRVIEREQSATQLRHLADSDALTGLPNLRVARDRLMQTVISCKRQNRQFALLFIDLDGFKTVNDSHGHEMGDTVLQIVARRISQTLRDMDSVARVGGDEFIVIVNPIESRDAVVTVAKKVIYAISKPIKSAGIESSVGASVGIAIFPDHAQQADDLLSLADRAMYQVKSHGKNSFSFIGEGMD